jgi:hypothetical protein
MSIMASSCDTTGICNCGYGMFLKGYLGNLGGPNLSLKKLPVIWGTGLKSPQAWIKRYPDLSFNNIMHLIVKLNEFNILVEKCFK